MRPRASSVPSFSSPTRHGSSSASAKPTRPSGTTETMVSNSLKPSNTGCAASSSATLATPRSTTPPPTTSLLTTTSPTSLRSPWSSFHRPASHAKNPPPQQQPTAPPPAPSSPTPTSSSSSSPSPFS